MPVNNVENILIKPVVTEKAVDLHNREGKYTFEVSLQSTHGQIKNALKAKYNVEVGDIKTHVLPGKRVRISKTSRFTTSQMRKKAIFNLKKGNLDIYKGE